MKPTEPGVARPRAFVTPRVITFSSSKLLDLIGPAYGHEGADNKDEETR